MPQDAENTKTAKKKAHLNHEYVFIGTARCGGRTRNLEIVNS